jgi:hypothetical protein
MADDDERLIDSTSLDDPPITVDQLSSSVSRAECNDSGELPLVADAATAQLAADIKPIVIGKLDRQSSGNNCSLDNRAIAKSSDDRIADSSQSVAVVSGSIGLNAEKSSEDMLDVLDVVIKREIGEGLEQCPAPAVSCVPVEMETDVTDEQLKTDACSRTEGSGMEVDASEMADVTVKSENS